MPNVKNLLEPRIYSGELVVGASRLFSLGLFVVPLDADSELVASKGK